MDAEEHPEMSFGGPSPQDFAHGTAILASALDAIPGVGEKTRVKLLKRFGSLKRLKAAGEEELAQKTGISARLARSITEALHGQA